MRAGGGVVVGVSSRNRARLLDVFLEAERHRLGAGPLRTADPHRDVPELRAYLFDGSIHRTGLFRVLQGRKLPVD